MSEKLQIGVYKLKEKILSETSKESIEVSISIELLKKAFKKGGFKSQIVQQSTIEEYEIYLFYKIAEAETKWKNFINEVAEESQDILKYTSSYNESFILLIRNSSNGIFYATTGGYGHTAIQAYTDNDFGLDILSRLIETKDKAIKSVKEKNLTGGIQGAIKFFRNEYNLNENESFGNFYQELQANLNKNILSTTFGFSNKDLKKGCLCIAKNSFTIRKAISFKEMVVLIKNCEKLIREVDFKVEINSIKKLVKSDKKLVGDLNQLLGKKLLDILNDELNTSVELCHKEFDKYLLAETFTFSYTWNGNEETKEFEEPLNNFCQISEYIKTLDTNNNASNFKRLLDKAYIITTNSDSNTITEELLKNHYQTEIEKEGFSYFHTNSEWYQIKPAFTAKLNDQCKSFIQANTYNGLTYKWDYPNQIENDFNSKHIGDNNTLVFDKLTPDNIEACDIMKWDNEFIYLIHVKAGFDNKMRDLSHQVHISARTIQEDVKTEKKYLGKLYSELENLNAQTGYYKNIQKQLKTISRNDFLTLFDTRRIIFVLAVYDTAKTIRQLSDINKYDSNIAKFSLQELVKNMRALNIDFKIAQIL